MFRCFALRVCFRGFLPYDTANGTRLYTLILYLGIEVSYFEEVTRQYLRH